MLILAVFALLAADDPLAGKSGPPLRKRVDLDRPLGPVGPVLAELAAAHKLPTVFDERTDLKAPARVFFKETRIGDVFAASARHAAGRFALVGDVCFIGPPETADRAAAAAVRAKAAVAKLPKAAKTALLARRRWAWDEKKTVAELVGEALAAAETPLAGNRNDLDVAPLPGALAEVSTLDAALAWCALADCTLEFDAAAGHAAIVALPKDAELERVLRCRNVPDAAQRAAVAKTQAPAGKDETPATVEAKGPTVRFRGPWSALWAASAAEDAPKFVRNAPPGTKLATYRMDFQNGTLRSFAEQLAKASGKKVEIDEASLKAAGKSPDDLVTCSARNLGLEDLLKLALEPLDLAATVGDGKVVIAAKK